MALGVDRVVSIEDPIHSLITNENTLQEISRDFEFSLESSRFIH